MSNKATREDLHELHRMLALQFFEMMKTPETLNASAFNVIRQFLKDNGITKDLVRAGDIKRSLESLVDAEVPFLPTFPEQ